jgi:hypothetical protein
MQPIMIVLIAVGCVVTVVMGLLVAQVMTLRHEIKAQALDFIKLDKSYADARSIVYRTEHAIQGMEKIQQHLMDRSVQVADEIVSLSERVSILSAHTSGIRLNNEQGQQKLEQYVHEKLSKVFATHEAVIVEQSRALGAGPSKFFITIKETV